MSRAGKGYVIMCVNCEQTFKRFTGYLWHICPAEEGDG